MLPKKFRLTKTKEIDKVFKLGKSSFDSILGVKTLASENNFSRFVIVASTKVSKKAVIRNQIKRRLHEIVRLNLTKIKPGFDFFILALPAAKDSDYHILEKSLQNHWQRLGTI
jgi:ribonuclease P protein component